MLDVEATFCYLGDMLCSSGGIAARCVAWGKFRSLLSVLTTRHLSPTCRIRGKVCGACVHSAMLHGSKTWGLNNLKLQQFCRDDRALIRWICGIKDGDGISSALVLQKFGVMDITSVLRCRLIRWYPVSNLSHTFRLPAL